MTTIFNRGLYFATRDIVQGRRANVGGNTGALAQDELNSITDHQSHLFPLEKQARAALPLEPSDS